MTKRGLGGLGVNLQQLAALFVDDVLREVEAAPALHLAAMMGVGALRCRSAAAGRLADLGLRDAIADADDHERYLALLRNIRNRSEFGSELAAHELGQEAFVRCAKVGQVNQPAW